MTEKTRKPYEKPRISEVKLEVEEAVLAACKSTVATTARGRRNIVCSSRAACRTVRSLGS
jgi:hypothetical protein